MKNLLILCAFLFICVQSEVSAQFNPNISKDIYTFSDYKNALGVATQVQYLTFFLSSNERDSIIQSGNFNLLAFHNLKSVNYEGRNEPISDSLFEKLLFDQLTKIKSINHLSIGNKALMHYDFSELDHVKRLSINVNQYNNTFISTFDSLQHLSIRGNGFSSEHGMIPIVPADASFFKLKTVTHIDIHYATSFPLEALSGLENLKTIVIHYYLTDTIDLPENWGNLRYLEDIQCFGTVSEIPTALNTAPSLKSIVISTPQVPKIDPIWAKKTNMYFALYTNEPSIKERRKLNKLHRQFLKYADKVCDDVFEKGRGFQLDYGKDCMVY